MKIRWTPRLDFDNIVELRDKEDWFRVYNRTRDNRTLLHCPVVCYRLRATGVFRERFELHSFPFDSQDLQIQMVSRHPFEYCTLNSLSTNGRRSQDRRPSLTTTGGQSAVTLIKNTKPEYQCVSPGDDTDKFTLYDEYVMSPDIVELRRETLPKHSTTRHVYPLLVLSMKVTRRPRFYLWHVYLPMSALVFLTFPVLLLGIDELSNRLQSLFALLLAAFSYKGWLGDTLPRCSYLTELDKYVLICIVLIILAAVQSAILFILHKRILGGDIPGAAVVDYAEDYMGLVALLAWSAYCRHLYIKLGVHEKTAALTKIEQEYDNVRYGSVDSSPGGWARRLSGQVQENSPNAVMRSDSGTTSGHTVASQASQISVPPDITRRPPSATQQSSGQD